MVLQPWIVREQRYVHCRQAACHEMLRNSWERRKSSEKGNGHGTTNAGRRHQTAMTPHQTFIRKVNYACTHHCDCSAPVCSLTYVHGIKNPSRSFYGSPRTCKAVCNMLIIYGDELLAPATTTKPALVRCPRLPSNIFTATAIRSITFCLILCYTKM